MWDFHLFFVTTYSAADHHMLTYMINSETASMNSLMNKILLLPHRVLTRFFKWRMTRSSPPPPPLELAAAATHHAPLTAPPLAHETESLPVQPTLRRMSAPLWEIAHRDLQTRRKTGEGMTTRIDRGKE